MKSGDLVKYREDVYGDQLNLEIGIVTDVEVWVDKGAPDRNFGINVYVLWPNGDQQTCDENELEIVANI